MLAQMFFTMSRDVNFALTTCPSSWAPRSLMVTISSPLQHTFPKGHVRLHHLVGEESDSVSPYSKARQKCLCRDRRLELGRHN